MVNIILCCDLATKKTGYALFEESGKLKKYDMIIASPKERDFRRRIVEIGNAIEDVISKHKVKTILLENVPIYNAAGSMLLVMQGYFTYIANKYNADLYLFNPNVWRKPMGLNAGNEKFIIKKNTVDFVNKEYDLDLMFYESDKKNQISQDDVADAIGLGHYFLNYFEEPK